MAYIPPSALQNTTFPAGNGLDLTTTLALIVERWNVTFPQVQYYRLDKRTTPVSDANTLSGEAGATKFDPLWNESVDKTQTTWKQPQGTDGVVKADDVEVFLAPIAVRAQVQAIEDSTSMKKYGFDSNDKWIDGLLLTIPTAILDTLGITCIPGDKFIWDGDEFVVKKAVQRGAFYNTNVRLYVVLGCDRRRHGS